MLSSTCRRTTLLTLAAFTLSLATPALARKRGKVASTEPGQYTDWKGEIDQLKILETFAGSNYQKVVVSGFETSDTPLPEADDNTFEPVKTVLADPVSAFVEGLREESDFDVSTGEGGAGALVIRGVVKEMDPGSRAGRYWGGFGAGAARTVLQIEIQDGGSGKTLLEIQQERRSGVGVAGGNYINLMNRNLRAIGKDVALVLSAF